MPKRTSKKPPRKWRTIAAIVRRNGIRIREGRGSRKKIIKETPEGRLCTTIHVHNHGTEIAPSYIDQIIDKFKKDETEFYG